MEKVVTWTKGRFESSYQIFCNSQICGNLIFETWNNHAFGIMSQKNYHFKANGLKFTTNIYGDNNQPLGVISFNIWQLKAVIILQDQTSFSWHYTNSWLSEWRINNFQGTTLNYKASNGGGLVNGEHLDDELVLLTGIYVKEFFSRLLLAVIGFIVAVFILRRL